jgi:phosphopantetheinyl transferase
MPVVLQMKTDAFEVLVWKIEENLEFFLKDVCLSYVESQDLANISNEFRKLEWMASRYVQRQVVKDSLIKDEWGKPNLAKETGFVSIAHCKDFAAAIYAESGPVGIDIEPMHEKALRIADKFLNVEELNFIDLNNQVEHIIASWCVKEAVYKWYGKRSLSFKNNIKMRSFPSGDAKVIVDFERDDLLAIREVHVLKIKNCMLAFTF